MSTPIHGLAVSLDPNQVSPGLLGFIIVVILGLATWALSRSMSKRLQRLDANRVDGEAPSGQVPSEEAGTGAGPR